MDSGRASYILLFIGYRDPGFGVCANLGLVGGSLGFRVWVKCAKKATQGILECALELCDYGGLGASKATSVPRHACVLLLGPRPRTYSKSKPAHN